ncbi:MAG: ribonuclease P protein component [bacterium]|nr:ribonuclease P protein component [bacterium]
MLKRKFRLGAKKLSFSNSLNSHFFTIKIVLNSKDYNRFSFVVSKKIDKNAVERNRIKRIFHNCIQELYPEIKTGFDMLFLVRSTVKELAKEKIYEEIKESLKKGQYLK